MFLMFLKIMEIFMTNFLTEIIVNVNTRRIIDFINDNYF